MALPPLDSVVIIGGSLTGLMHALALLHHTPNTTKITLLERSPSTLLHNQGAGVVAGAETQAFFSRYVVPVPSDGRTGDREIAVRSKERIYLDRDGRVVQGSREVREQRMTGWDVLYRLLRWRVDGLGAGEYLDNICGSGSGGEVDEGEDGKAVGRKAVYENGCKVSSIQDLISEGVKVSFTDESGEERSLVADLVIAADGGSSVVRRELLPFVERTYAGYVAFRGTVPEDSISKAAADVFVEKFAFFHTEGIQILAYLIPGANGALKRGERLVNWVWYCNYPEDSDAYKELMTDNNGRQHAVTLPVGGMQEGVWTRQKEYARKVLPPQYAELVVNTTHPFVQCITDVISPENSFMDGKVLLVGDALAGFRPHTAASTGQGAFDALTFADLLQGRIDREQYKQKVMNFAQEVQRHGVVLGERSQFGRHPFAA